MTFLAAASRRGLLFGLCWLAALLCGCGGGESTPPLGRVSGKVLDNGTPVAGANVEFLASEGRPSTATTNELGEFTLTYLEGISGALLGEHKVRITKPFGAAGGMGAGGDGPPPPPREVPKEPVPVNWPSPVEVRSGDNKFEFDLSKPGESPVR